MTREEGYYWVRVCESGPQIAKFNGVKWWCIGISHPWHKKQVTIISGPLKEPN
jgi:hypothetical protein